MEVKLKGTRPTITVNVAGVEYKVPLTFNRVEFEALGSAEDKVGAMAGFFAKYLGEVYEELGDDDLITLYNAWAEARAELGVPEMGEPSASPKR